MIAATPAFADRQHARYMQNYYSSHPRDNDYWRWHKNRSHWSNNEYRDWYRHRHHGNDNNDSAAALFLGLAAGTVVGGLAASGGGNSHVQACAARYRSYDVASDTFVGFDGYRHQCTAY